MRDGEPHAERKEARGSIASRALCVANAKEAGDWRQIAKRSSRSTQRWFLRKRLSQGVARYEAKIWRKRKIAIGLSFSPCGFFLKNVFPAVGNFQGFDRVGDPGCEQWIEAIRSRGFLPLEERRSSRSTGWSQKADG
jgi:hypothetical protein